MRVTLFRDMPQEHWLSMDRYADNLQKALRVLAPTLELKEFSINQTQFFHPFRSVFKFIPKWGDYLQDKFYSRYLLYPKLAKNHQGDINHILDHSYCHVINSLEPKITLITCHDLTPLKMPGEDASKELFKAHIGSIKKAALIIAVSESTKRDLIEILGVPEEKIRVIYEAYEENFKPIKDDKEIKKIRAKFGLSQLPLVLNVGGSDGNKNIEGILKAVKILMNRNWDFLFLKVGQDFTDQQKRMVEELGIENYVLYLGRVSENDLVLLYNAARVLVSPSTFEGFGFTVLEAMATSLPVICADSASLPEIGGEVAWYVQASDSEELAAKTEKMLSLPTQEYQELKKKSLENAKRFSWQKTAQETLQAYESVLKG